MIVNGKDIIPNKTFKGAINTVIIAKAINDIKNDVVNNKEFANV